MVEFFIGIIIFFQVYFKCFVDFFQWGLLQDFGCQCCVLVIIVFVVEKYFFLYVFIRSIFLKRYIRKIIYFAKIGNEYIFLWK